MKNSSIDNNRRSPEQVPRLV